MPTGANPRREREFRKLEQQFRQEGRYRGREEEVAARIVNRQRAQAGETREAPKRNYEAAHKKRKGVLQALQA